MTTVYLCPVCSAELLRTTLDAPDWDLAPLAPLLTRATSVHEAAAIAVREQVCQTEAALLVAVADHRCSRPWRWRRWMRAHRDELAQARLAASGPA